MSDPLSLPGTPVSTHSVENRDSTVVSQLGGARALLHQRLVLKPDQADLTHSQKHHRKRIIDALLESVTRSIAASNLPNRQGAIFALDDVIEQASRMQAVLMGRWEGRQ